MSTLLVKEFEGDPREVWVLDRGKYTGRTLREVAQDDAGYLRWMYLEVDDLTKEQTEAIEEVAGQEGVDLSRGARASREDEP